MLKYLSLSVVSSCRCMLVVMLAMFFAAFSHFNALATESLGITDRSLILVEGVEQRLAAIDVMVENVARSELASGGKNIAKTKPLLMTAIKESFDVPQMMSAIARAVESSGGRYEESAAFERAAKALATSYEKIDRMFAEKDERLGREVEVRLADLQRKKTIDEIVSSMASPDLSVETAIFQQVADVALTISPDAPLHRLTNEEKAKFDAELPKFLSDIRHETANERFIPKENARTYAIFSLTSSLALLSDEDLYVLDDFYRSSVGREKVKYLVKSFQKEWEKSTLNTLKRYYELFADEQKK